MHGKSDYKCRPAVSLAESGRGYAGEFWPTLAASSLLSHVMAFDQCVDVPIDDLFLKTSDVCAALNLFPKVASICAKT